MVEMRRRNDDAARRVFEEGLHRARAMPFPYGEARLLLTSGLLDQQCGHEVQACEALEEALGIFQRLGASKDVEQVRMAMRMG